MARPLSMDLRERAMMRLDEGESVREVAAALSVAPSSVVKWSQRRRATGSVRPGQMGGHVACKIRGEDAIWMRGRIASGVFTLHGLVAELAEREVKVDYRTVWKFVHRTGFSFKKNTCGERAGPGGRGPQARALEAPSGRGEPAAAGVHR